MRFNFRKFVVIRLVIGTIILATESLVAAPSWASSPWDGTWVLETPRSSPHVQGAAVSYVLHLAPDGSIRWEIPAIGEIVSGRIDGEPMPVHRTIPTSDLTLSVRPLPGGAPTLAYEVRQNGRPTAGGRMTLIENGMAWVDVGWLVGRETQGAELVYVRQDRAVLRDPYLGGAGRPGREARRP